MEATTAGLDQHLKDPEYANWVKNTLAVKITLDVLKLHVDEELPVIQTSITSKGPPGVACTSCCVSEAPKCPNDVCNTIMKEIKERHRLSKPSFCNTNAKQWSADAWEIAKCFMPPTGGYQYCTQSNADFSGVINVIINCKHFDTLVSCDLNRNGNIFCEARTMRNLLMHSDSLKVSEPNLQNNLDLLIRLLSCFNDTTLNSPGALEQIQKLKTGEFQVTLDNVEDAREQVAIAIWEEIDGGKEEIRFFVNLLIKKLKQEIKTATPTWKAQQHRLIGNFIKGCKMSLIRLVLSESENVKPERYSQHKWNFEEFLNKIELLSEVKSLLHRHKCLLYPEDGSPSDINKWDIFLLCHILSIETSAEHLVNYMLKLQNMRDKILDNPYSFGEEGPDFGEEDLDMLSGFLDEPLRTEIKSIYASEDITDDALQLQSVLKSWQQNEYNMKCKPIDIKALEETKKQAKRIEIVESRQVEDRREIDDLSEKVGNINTSNAETQNQIDELREEMRKLRSTIGNNIEIEARAEIKPMHVDPEEKEQIQTNITSENMDENIAISNGGLAYFQEQTKFEHVQMNEGSIIVKVQCKSIKELIRFWDICMDGNAVKALSKIRDDYRRILQCQTLEFDIVLTKKEVNRCMDHLVDRISSQSLDQSILRDIQAKVAMLESVSEAETQDLAEKRIEFGKEGTFQAETQDLAEEKIEFGKEGTFQAETQDLAEERIEFGKEGTFQVVRQSVPKHHILDDMWMRMARKEINDGRKTEVLHYIGQNYVLCVDISESMAEGSAWLQTKNFVEGFISGLENLEKYYPGIPLYLALVTFGKKTEVLQRLTNEMKLVERALDNLCLGGPTPMYGGISLGIATAEIPDRGMGNPTLIIITDGKPTETTLYAGPDSLDSSKEEKVKQDVIQVLEKFKDGVDFTFVCVGNADSVFIGTMAAVCQGEVYFHTDGHAILKRHFVS